MLNPLKYILSDKLIGSAVRHLGTTVGGALLLAGAADESTSLAVGGAVTVLAGFAASLLKRAIF